MRSPKPPFRILPLLVKLVKAQSASSFTDRASFCAVWDGAVPILRNKPLGVIDSTFVISKSKESHTVAERYPGHFSEVK